MNERKQEEGLEGHGLMTCCNGHRKTSVIKYRLHGKWAATTDTNVGSSKICQIELFLIIYGITNTHMQNFSSSLNTMEPLSALMLAEGRERSVGPKYY